MSDEQVPDIEEIKERLKIEIEEEIEIEIEEEEEPLDLGNEFQNLAEQVANTLRNAWESAERQKLEADIRNGVKSFVTEIDKVIEEIRQAPVTQKVKEKKGDLQQKVEANDLTLRVRKGLAKGLRRASQELNEVATRFNKIEEEKSDNE